MYVCICVNVCVNGGKPARRPPRWRLLVTRHLLDVANVRAHQLKLNINAFFSSVLMIAALNDA
jgi:hypothetical protein